MKHALMILGLALVWTFSGAQSAVAQDANWQTACDGNRCQLFSEIKNDQGTTLARLYLQNLAQEKDNASVVAIASLPLGVYIPSGVGVDVDEDMVFKAQLLECREDEGCRAAFDMKPKILDAMKKGNEMTIAIVDGRTRRAISFNFSLQGFTAAYKDFSAKM